MTLNATITSSKLSFRNMRNTLIVAHAQVAMLLALPHVEWKEIDYAQFMVMEQMWRNRDNPTRNQVLVHVGAWLRFLKRLMDALPDDDMKANCLVEFSKTSKGYEELLA